MPSPDRFFAPIDYKTRFPALDGIRALAVTMVFLLHFGGGSHGGRALQIFNSIRLHLGAGVDIFFVMSGFLITGILFDTRNDSHFFKRFFARRAVRIFPVLYLLFAILALLTPLFHYRWQWKQLWFLAYIGNLFANVDFSLYDLPSPVSRAANATIRHLWTLCVEEQFYLFWPFVVFFIRDRRKLLWTSAALCALTLALRIAAVLLWTPDIAERWLKRSLPFKLDALVFGAILALLLRGPAADRVQRSCKWLFLAGLAALASINILSPGYFSPWDLTLGMTSTAILGVGLIGMTLRPGALAFRLFNLAPMRYLGRYSYGFYIFHLVWEWFWITLLMYAGRKTHSLILAGLIELPLAFVTTFLMAKLSYDLFEVRFLRLKRGFEYDSEQATHRTAFAPDGN